MTSAGPAVFYIEAGRPTPGGGYDTEVYFVGCTQVCLRKICTGTAFRCKDNRLARFLLHIRSDSDCQHSNHALAGDGRHRVHVGAIQPVFINELKDSWTRSGLGELTVDLSSPDSGLPPIANPAPSAMPPARNEPRIQDLADAAGGRQEPFPNAQRIKEEATHASISAPKRRREDKSLGAPPCDFGIGHPDNSGSKSDIQRELEALREETGHQRRHSALAETTRIVSVAPS